MTANKQSKKLLFFFCLGNEHGRAFRDLDLENKIFELTQKIGIGAQFGGKYFCHDVRVVRLPRHGASCPVGLGVSCSADRQVIVHPFLCTFSKLKSDMALPNVYIFKKILNT